MKCMKCDSKHLARGLCQNHYMQGRRNGWLVPLKTESQQEYIKARVSISESGCWEWSLSRNTQGYGRLVRNGKTWFAHRFSYTAFIGKIATGLQINHKCNNTSCVNPEHLYAGTQKQNVKDMNDSGRRNQVFGERGGNSKINDEIAVAILMHNGIARLAAEQYGVSLSLVYAIKKRLIWRHVSINNVE